jgi:hypothetical protein
MKKLIATVIALLLMAGLASCSGAEKSEFEGLSKKELIALAEEHSLTIENLQFDLDEAKTLLAGQYEGAAEKPRIETMDDGTGRLTFISVDSQIIFPKAFSYPGSEQAPSTGSLDIVDRISIVPGNGWIIRQSGTTTELYHPSGIQGRIVAGRVAERFPVKDLEASIFASFFSEATQAAVTYSRIFAEDLWSGMQGMTQIRINGEMSFMRAGMMAVNDSSVIYSFIYTGVQDAEKDGTVRSLLSTMNIYNRAVRIEN